MNNGLKWVPVDSSNVERLAYDEQTSTLVVLFKNGGLYSYNGVDMEVFTSMQFADSVGSFLNKVIKAVYPFEKWVSEEALIAHLQGADGE